MLWVFANQPHLLNLKIVLTQKLPIAKTFFLIGGLIICCPKTKEIRTFNSWKGLIKTTKWSFPSKNRLRVIFDINKTLFNYNKLVFFIIKLFSLLFSGCFHSIIKFLSVCLEEEDAFLSDFGWMLFMSDVFRLFFWLNPHRNVQEFAQSFLKEKK